MSCAVYPSGVSSTPSVKRGMPRDILAHLLGQAAAQPGEAQRLGSENHQRGGASGVLRPRNHQARAAPTSAAARIPATIQPHGVLLSVVSSCEFAAAAPAAAAAPGLTLLGVVVVVTVVVVVVVVVETGGACED